jgi:hypothetical protein
LFVATEVMELRAVSAFADPAIPMEFSAVPEVPFHVARALLTDVPGPTTYPSVVGAAHTPSPRQKVVAAAPVPLLRDPGATWTAVGSVVVKPAGVRTLLAGTEAPSVTKLPALLEYRTTPVAGVAGATEVAGRNKDPWTIPRSW